MRRAERPPVDVQWPGEGRGLATATPRCFTLRTSSRGARIRVPPCEERLLPNELLATGSSSPAHSAALYPLVTQPLALHRKIGHQRSRCSSTPKLELPEWSSTARGRCWSCKRSSASKDFGSCLGGRGPSRRRGPGGAVQETGIQCEFQCIAVFREHHGAAHSATDFYTIFCCLLSEEAYGTEQLVGPAAQAARG